MGIDINTIELHKEKYKLSSNIMNSEYSEVREMLRRYPKLIEADLDVPYSQEDADDEDEEFFTNRTPLYYAVAFSDLKMVKILVDEFGADINKGDNENRTPLHKLCVDIEENQDGMMDYFLSKGADVNIATYENGTTPLMRAVDLGFDMVEKLIKHGADVNAIDNYGYNIFFWIASKYDLKYKDEATKNEILLEEIVKLLIENGANINYIKFADRYSPSSTTALDYAEEYKRDLVIKVFRKYGAKRFEELR